MFYAAPSPPPPSPTTTTAATITKSPVKAIYIGLNCLLYPGFGYRLSFDRNTLCNGVRGLHLMKFNPGHWMLSKHQRTLFKISYTQCLLIKIYVYFVGVAGLGR